VQYLWSVFSGYDGWLVVHAFTPYAIALAMQSRMCGLLAAYLYETLTIVLFFTFGYDIGYAGVLESLVQDPTLAIVGVALASTSFESTGTYKRRIEIVALLSFVLTIFFLGSRIGSDRFMWFTNSGGLLPIVWYFARQGEGSILRRNNNAMDAVRVYSLLCVASWGSYTTGSSTFLWMIAVVAVPEVFIEYLSRSKLRSEPLP